MRRKQMVEKRAKDILKAWGGGDKPVKLVEICKRLGIPVKFAPVRGNKAAAIGGGAGMEAWYFILVDPSTPPADRERLIAHELGHIQLGHVDASPPTEYLAEWEEEADYFAEILLGG